MNLEALQSFFGWCLVINYAVLLLWVLAYIAGGGAIMARQATLFRIDEDELRRLHCQLMGVFKILIMIFCLAPWLALHFGN